MAYLFTNAVREDIKWQEGGLSLDMVKEREKEREEEVRWLNYFEFWEKLFTMEHLFGSKAEQ